MSKRSKRSNRGSGIPNFEEAVRIWRLLLDGDYFQHEIAALLGFNQGRISEVKTGKRHPGAKAIALA